MLAKFIIAASLLAASAGVSFAHVTLEKAEAAVGSGYRAVFRVPHGCQGQPTEVVRVRIPEGFIAAKPMPKAGWRLEKVRGPYEKSYQFHGRPLAEGVKEIVWRGGNLADDEYDEFIISGFLAADLKPGAMLHFPVVQECPGGTRRALDRAAGRRPVAPRPGQAGARPEAA